MKIKKGDKVIVISGASRGKKGDVVKVFPENDKKADTNRSKDGR